MRYGDSGSHITPWKPSLRGLQGLVVGIVALWSAGCAEPAREGEQESAKNKPAVCEGWPQQLFSSPERFQQLVPTADSPWLALAAGQPLVGLERLALLESAGASIPEQAILRQRLTVDAVGQLMAAWKLGLALERGYLQQRLDRGPGELQPGLEVLWLQWATQAFQEGAVAEVERALGHIADGSALSGTKTLLRAALPRLQSMASPEQRLRLWWSLQADYAASLRPVACQLPGAAATRATQLARLSKEALPTTPSSWLVRFQLDTPDFRVGDCQGGEAGRVVETYDPGVFGLLAVALWTQARPRAAGGLEQLFDVAVDEWFEPSRAQARACELVQILARPGVETDPILLPLLAFGRIESLGRLRGQLKETCEMRSTGAACVVDPLRVEQELVAILDDTARCERQLGEQMPDAMEALARLRPQAVARSASALRPYTGPTCSPAVQHRALEVWRARLGDLPAAVALDQRLMLLADWFPTEGCSLVPEAAQLLETFKYQPEHQFLSPLFEMVRLYDRSCKHSSGGGGGSIQ